MGEQLSEEGRVLVRQMVAAPALGFSPSPTDAFQLEN